MKLREIINSSISEASSGKDMDKLVSFLKKAAMGKIKEQGMIAAGFNLRNAAANNESRLAESLSVRLSINMTEDDLKEALKELNMKSASEIVSKWLDAKRESGDQKFTKEKSLEGSEGKKRF